MLLYHHKPSVSTSQNRLCGFWPIGRAALYGAARLILIPGFKSPCWYQNICVTLILAQPALAGKVEGERYIKVVKVFGEKSNPTVHSEILEMNLLRKQIFAFLYGPLMVLFTNTSHVVGKS